MAIAGKRVYVSGATGFFGRNLLALFALLSERGANFEVTALSRDPERFLTEQVWCRDQRWLRWQRCDVQREWPDEGHYDLLLHAATDTHADAHRRPLELFDSVVAGTRQALALAARSGVSRVLLCGSGAQYGPLPAGTRVQEATGLACDPATAANAYGEAKRASEMLAALHAQRHGFAVVNTRGFAFVGPGFALDGHFAIGNFIRDALAGRNIVLNTAGTAVRSYLYGADLAVWLLLLLLEAPGGAVVNVGSDRPIRVVDLAGRVRDLVKPELVLQTGVPVAGEARQFYVPDIERARTLGLDVWTDLDLAIQRTALWYQVMRSAS